jgi:hypothetical protein
MELSSQWMKNYDRLMSVQIDVGQEKRVRGYALRLMREPLNCRLRGGETGLSSSIPGGIDLKQSNSGSGIISEFRVNYERCIGLFQDLRFFRVCRVVFGREKRNAKTSSQGAPFLEGFFSLYALCGWRCWERCASFHGILSPPVYRRIM